MAETATPHPGKQRVFFALWPDPELRQQLAVAAAAVHCSGSRARAVPVENYHLTLAFLGALTPASVRDVLTAGRSVRFAAFEVVLRQSGYWQRSRVAWLAPDGSPLSLTTLIDDLSHRLAGFGFALETEPYRPHVTLARDADGATTAPLPVAIRWPVRSFALVESTPGPAGPVYTPLQEFPAAG